jgi:predicted transcriptional regulator
MAERYPTSLKLDASLKLRVQRLAQVHGRTTHGLLCDAIRAFVEQEERRVAAREEALAKQPGQAGASDDPGADLGIDPEQDATGDPA